ncbi:AarF domain-containing protein kinase 1 [Coccomyxa sp. Obi]|nr:AarF domain-containing protein kinase 1 [Coccomyxa sp. Obi]
MMVETCDYKWSLRGLVGDEYEQAQHKVHERSADRLQRLCFANGGIYIKLGQHIAQLDHLLPEEYVLTMRRTMLDQCPVSPYAEVARIVKEDLGSTPEELFASFEHDPIASASLAQVHRATAHDGRQLAVKVQHAGLRDSCTADTLTVEFLVKAVHLLFPKFDYNWLVDQIKESLPQELDFSVEVANAERCRKNFSSKQSRVRGRVAVPEILHPLSSKRVLTMEFVTGANVCDKAALARMGLKASDVARLVSETFNEMIFIFGDIHCDPHAANMLIRKKHGKAELVLLDHGLYKRITDDFRRQYAGLWRALVFGDAEGIKAHAAAMNAADSYKFFAGMLTMRPWDEVTRVSADHLYLGTSPEERKMIQGYAAQFAREISDMLRRIPRPLLLLLKTNDCLRTVDACLGQPVNSFMMTARECTRALNEARMRERPGLRTCAACLADVIGVEARIAALALMSWWSRQNWRLFRRSSSRREAALQPPAVAMPSAVA